MGRGRALVAVTVVWIATGVGTGTCGCHERAAVEQHKQRKQIDDNKCATHVNMAVCYMRLAEAWKAKEAAGEEVPDEWRTDVMKAANEQAKDDEGTPLFDLSEALTDPVLEQLTPDKDQQAKIVAEFKAVKGKLGLAKLESGSGHIRTFVGLIAKMYCLEIVDFRGKLHYTKKGKGVPGKTLKKQTTMEDFLQMLMNPFSENPASKADFHTLRSYNHQMYLMHMEKKMLGIFNDKVVDRYPLPNRPLGHSMNRIDKFADLFKRLSLRRAFRGLKA